MKALPFTYIVKGQYWYFRHTKVGQVRIVGELGSPIFMQQYRKWLGRAGHTLKSVRAHRASNVGAAGRAAFQIYFVRMGADGPIKIGSAVDVPARVRTLQTGSPEPLLLLATCEGGQAEERRLHGQFDHCKLRGEWFSPSEDLLEHIRNISSTKEFKC